jgi:eukaryotic-like serine/threonine-protein kinase
VDVGEALDGRYRVDSPIATGGMGEVWRATDSVLGRTVAVKLLRADLSADASFGIRFRAEAHALATVRHPGVVDVYDYGEIASTGGSTELAYLVMAYVRGEPLSRRLTDGGRLDPATTMSIVAQLADALHATHEAGIIHRDVKPDNIVIAESGQAVLVDFGIAQTPATEGLTNAQDVLGTALYMAPEQAMKKPVTPKTDMYALGAVAYHCLAGTPPFSGENALAIALAHVRDEPPALPGDIPVAVRDVVSRAMAKDPARRFPNAAAMASAARHAASRSAAHGTATHAPIVGVAAALTTTPFGSVPDESSYARDVADPAENGYPAQTFVGMPERSHGGRIAAVVAATMAIAVVAIAVLLATTHRNVNGTSGVVNPPATSSQHSGRDTPTPHTRAAGNTQSARHGAPAATPAPTANPTTRGTPKPSATATTAPPTNTGTPTTTPSAGSSSSGGSSNGGPGGSGGGDGTPTPPPTPGA